MNSAVEKARRALLCVPVWLCLVTLSALRTLFSFAKVKYRFQRKAINRISNLCKRLFSIIRNPYRIEYHWYVPQYYIQERVPELPQINLEKVHQIISHKRQEMNATQK